MQTGDWMQELLTKKGWEVIWIQGLLHKSTKKQQKKVAPLLPATSAKSAGGAEKGNQLGQLHE